MISGCRMTAQLLLVGLILRFLFSNTSAWLIILMSMVMLLAAGHEVQARQKRKIAGISGFLIGVASMFVSSFSLTILALIVIIGIDPWYTPQYAVPLLGMLLGNTMNGISIAADRLTSLLYEQREKIEQRLMLGQTWHESSREIRQESIRAGLIPIINAMAAAGLVSLPGMMTGQILGGSSPLDAVSYQILIMFLIAAGTGFGILLSIFLISRRLFDERHRLCLDKLSSGPA